MIVSFILLKASSSDSEVDKQKEPDSFDEDDQNANVISDSGDEESDNNDIEHTILESEIS